MWLWLSHQSDVDVFELLKRLNETFLYLALLFSVALVTSIFQSVKLDLWQVFVIFVLRRNSSSCHHKMLKLVLCLIKTNLFHVVKVCTDAHRHSF